MSKKPVSSEILLKKAETFEKLAIYSDRKLFLKSIAQGFTPEELHEWENTDELGNKKNYVKYPKLTENEPAGFTPEEVQQWENKDTLGNPVHTGIPPVSTSPSEQQVKTKTTQPTQEKDSVKNWINRLVDTVNTYINKVGPQTAQNMMNPNREAIAKQLDSHAIAELVRLYNQLGGANNPYTSPEQQELASKIKNTVEHFGKNFSAQVSSLTNYNQMGL